MKRELRLFLLALQFFTRVPVPRCVGFDADGLNQSARYFAAIGLLVGGVAAAVWWLSCLAFPPLVAALLSTAATMLLTGGFHEDGLADTLDGLGGSASRERALEIMKDSRIGAYAAMGLVMTLALKVAALAAMPVESGVASLLLAHTASRAAAVGLMCFLPYAGDAAHAKAKPLARPASPWAFCVAAAWSAGVAIVLLVVAEPGQSNVIAGLIGCAAAALGCARWFRRRIGGFTGDTLGATQQIAELVTLLAWLGTSGWG